MTLVRTLCLVCSCFSASGFAQSAQCSARPFPSSNWEDASAEVRMAKASQIQALETALFTLAGEDGDRKGIRTDGLVVIHRGKLIYEKYGRGFGPNNRHLSWSVAKSYTSVFTGVAARLGALTLDDSICDHLTELAGKPGCAIKVRHPLTFTSGLAWQEGYENASYQTSSVISMFFGSGHKDQLTHILTHQQAAEPGSQWLYSTGDAQLQAAVVKRALMNKGYGPDALWTQLLDRIGSPNVTLEEDSRGTPQGGSHVWATPRDFARFGYLMLADGCWNGDRLLPAGWVAASTTPSDAFMNTTDASETTPSGYSWWLNRPVPSRNQPKPWADAPDDAYSAIGHWGQYVIVIPSEELVIVRTGDDRQAGAGPNLIIKNVLPLVKP